MPRTAKVQFGSLGHEVGFKVSTLYQLNKTLIHETTNSWRITKEGVPSLILRSKDVDEGDQVIIISEIKLSSQKQEMKVLSAFKKNLINNLPIRVVRSENIRGQYAPLCGYRYDGLYAVTGISNSEDKKNQKKYVQDILIYLRLLTGQPVVWQRPPHRVVALQTEESLESQPGDVIRAESSTIAPPGEPYVVVQNALSENPTPEEMMKISS